MKVDLVNLVTNIVNTGVSAHADHSINRAMRKQNFIGGGMVVFAIGVSAFQTYKILKEIKKI